jgi:hypothetical protein
VSLGVQPESTRQPPRLLVGTRNVGPGKGFSTVLLAPVWAVSAVALLLTACASPIPPQPSGGAAPSQAQATSAGKPSPGQPQVATVTGTGRFGLSIRKEPGLSAERVATVPDGFQGAVVSGPVGKDGADWYQIQGQDVDGWASGTYLALANGQLAPSPVAATPGGTNPATSAPSGSGPGTANPLATPLGGLLSQLNREANYDVNGSGIFVEARLKPAVDHLAGSKTATSLIRKAAPTYLRLTVAHFPATSEGGEFSTLGHSIKVADAMLLENIDVQSAVISHELQHAADILVDHAAPDTAQDCVNLEVRAYRSQELVWIELTKPSPPQTRMERELDQLSHVVDSPTFAQQLAKLYANECSNYGNKP